LFQVNGAVKKYVIRTNYRSVTSNIGTTHTPFTLSNEAPLIVSYKQHLKLSFNCCMSLLIVCERGGGTIYVLW